MGAIKPSAAGIAYPAGASGLSPVLMIFVLLFSFRCRDISMILCLFVLFLSAIALDILLPFTSSDLVSSNFLPKIP
jgi:F0F1-type ATP synthase assembly protein I